MGASTTRRRAEPLRFTPQSYMSKYLSIDMKAAVIFLAAVTIVVRSAGEGIIVGNLVGNRPLNIPRVLQAMMPSRTKPPTPLSR